MPTGYTDCVGSGKVKDFATFAMQCARAFGALIEMRDEPHDAPIPDEFTPSDWHAKKLEASRDELTRIEAATDEQVAAQEQADYQSRLAAWKERNERRDSQRRNYEAMLAEVHAWTPPSVEHRALKQFMVKQLSESIDFDCRNEYDREPERVEPALWREQKLQGARANIAYHEKGHAEELAHTASRNQWVRQLRESLKETTAAS